MDKIEKTKAGRPERVPTESEIAVVLELAAKGMGMHHIAARLGMAYNTFTKLLQKNEDFALAFNVGIAEGKLRNNNFFYDVRDNENMDVHARLKAASYIGSRFFKDKEESDINLNHVGSININLSIKQPKKKELE